MKMNVEIDLDDFWMESDSGTLSEQLKDHISNQVRHQIWNDMKKKVEEHCEVAIKKEIEKHMYTQMNLYIADFIKEGKVKSSQNSSNEVTIEEFIKEKFVRDSGWGSPATIIQELAKKFGQELKTRYDVNFATQIVVKLSEQKLLKEEVAHLLLPQQK